MDDWILTPEEQKTLERFLSHEEDIILKLFHYFDSQATLMKEDHFRLMYHAIAAKYAFHLDCIQDQLDTVKEGTIKGARPHVSTIAGSSATFMGEA